MRWNFLLHLLLSALLLAQQPSVIVRNGRWVQDTLAPSTQGSEGGQLVEEEELHAIRAPRGPRLETLALPPPGERPVRLDRVMEPRSAPRCCDTAEAHWRAALLPLRSPLEGEPPAPV